MFAGSYYRYSSPSDASSGHPFLPHHQSPDIQSLSPGQSLGSPAGRLQTPGGNFPSQGLVASPASSPEQGQMTHAPSSHFISSGSFDFGGRGDSLGTTGLLPNLGLANLGSQPLELTEMELESTPDTEPFVSPREWGSYPQAPPQGPVGPSGTAAINLQLSSRFSFQAVCVLPSHNRCRLCLSNVCCSKHTLGTAANIITIVIIIVIQISRLLL